MENGNPALDSTEEQLTNQENGSADAAALIDPAARLAALAAERDRLAEEKADLLDRLLRRQAEFENFRRRAERERAGILEFAGMEAAGALLPVVDDLERALRAAPETDGPEREFIRGVEMIYQRLLEALKKLGLEPIEAAGQPFDPNLHHAVETVETEEAEDHTVLEELQRGYNFRGKLLRPAMVRVAVKPS